MVNLGFWSKIEKPILCLAPMADVTDSAFRRVIASCSNNSLDTFSSLGTDIFLLENSSARPSRPAQGPLGEVSRERINSYVTWTEFVSADGLVLAHEEGKKKLLKDLEYSEIERPIVAQLFGSRPENMRKAAYLVASLGFDGLDINMGCPDKSIEKQGAGAAMIKNPRLAREVIRAAKEGVEEYAKEQGKEAIPVSVKTRLGYNKDELEGPARPDGTMGGWLPELLAEEPAVITIHARTRKEMSKVPARWERIKEAVEIRNTLPFGEGVGGGATLIFGNGDVDSVADAYAKAEATGCDGVMLGRAIFGNPFLFANLATAKQSSQIEHPAKLLAKSDNIDPQLKLKALLAHIKLFDQNLGKVKSFAVMKKHFKSYLSGLPDVHDLKEELMNAESAESAILALEKYLGYN